MIPILYSSKTTVFLGNGLGLLADAKYCKVTEELNGGYELSLVIPIYGRHALDITENSVIKAKPNYFDKAQPFRVYSVEKNYNGEIDVKAAHISYDTAGIPIKPFTAEKLDDAASHLNSDRMLLNGSKFMVYNKFDAKGTLEVKTPGSLRNLLGDSSNSLVSIYGGELEYDGYVINFVKKRGKDLGICFREGKNISDFQHEANTEDLYTAVLGFWKKSGSNGQADTIIYGTTIETNADFPYDKIYLLDTSSDIQTENNANATIEQIDKYVEDFISKNGTGIPKYKMKIDYTENDEIIHVCLGDRVGIIYPDYKIKAVARCNKVVFDTINERNESIEVGVDNNDLADSIVELSKKNK